MNTQRLIVIVDDVAIVRKSLRLLLEKENFRVEEFESFEAAQAGMKICFPSLIFVNCQSPTLRGLALIAQWRVKEKRKDFKIIMVLNQKDDAIINKGMSLGADDYLLKPFDAVHLAAKIRF